MPVHGPIATSPRIGSTPEAVLAGYRAPAWVIDPARGRVLAANPAGATRLGLRPDAASGTLDAAMPGLVRLRALMREPLKGGRREPLIFWTAYGAESLLCTVRHLPEDASGDLILVSMSNGEDDEPALAPPRAAAQPPVAVSAGDAATLKKIARAIRTGFVKAPEPVTPVENDLEGTPTAAAAPGAETEPQANVSKLAHELRTPLSAIVVAAEIMKDQRLGAMGNERYHGYSADIHDNARHALAVIDRLLAGGATEEHAVAFNAVELDLNQSAESSVSAMRPLAEAAGLSLAQELHSRLPRVTADAMSVKQVLFNLLANAIKFTKAGDVRIVTGLGFDRSVFVAVQDTGPGMTPEQIAKVLDSDSPPQPEPKQEGGLGIGLPLAQSLAKANGARIEIDSTPGEGTVVALIFPKDRVVARAQAPASSN